MLNLHLITYQILGLYSASVLRLWDAEDVVPEGWQYLSVLKGEMASASEWTFSSSGHHMFVDLWIYGSAPGFHAKIHFGMCIIDNFLIGYDRYIIGIGRYIGFGGYIGIGR